MGRAVRRDPPTPGASLVTHRRCTGSLGCGALLEYVNGNPAGHAPGCEWKERSLAYNLDLSARFGEADRLRQPTQEGNDMTTTTAVQTVAFGDLSREALVTMATAQDIKVTTKMTKADLIAALQSTKPLTTSGERVAAKKMAAGRVAPKPKPHAVNDIDQAATEQAALKAWQNSGKKGPRPDTSTYDRLTAPAKGATSAERKPKAAAGKRAPKAASGVRYTRDGEPVRDSMNRLSTLAYFLTARIESPKSPRIGAADFRALLAQLGVEHPETTTWDVVLPNGTRVGATQPGDKPAPAAKAPAAKRAPAKKAVAKKAPAKRASAMKSPTTRATPKAPTKVRTKARPDGTPIPKGVARKK